MFDSPGHPTDPALRFTGSPALPEDVKASSHRRQRLDRRRYHYLPRVTVGEGSVVARGAIVMSNVPPNVIVAGSLRGKSHE